MRPPVFTLKCMLYTIAMILVILWFLGPVTGAALGGFHIFLVIATVAVLVRILAGRKPV